LLRGLQQEAEINEWNCRRFFCPVTDKEVCAILARLFLPAFAVSMILCNEKSANRQLIMINRARKALKLLLLEKAAA
jgi:hypothetical protein